jgi:hypothetical protein
MGRSRELVEEIGSIFSFSTTSFKEIMTTPDGSSFVD